MRNAQSLPQLSSCCIKCDLRGVFTYTPCGADYITCPCCESYDILTDDAYSNDSRLTFLFDAFSTDDPDYDNDNRLTMHFCPKCCIMFDIGCTHAKQGCSDDVYNAHFIKKWEHKVSKEIYEGMPLFDGGIDDWLKNAPLVTILEKHCPHNGAVCANPYYYPTEKKCYFCK